MAEKVDMTPGEWVLRFASKMVGLASALLGVAGMWIVCPEVLQQLLVHGALGKAACVGILCIGASFGLAPLAVEVDQQILNLLRLKPLPAPSKDQPNRESRG